MNDFADILSLNLNLKLKNGDTDNDPKILTNQNIDKSSSCHNSLNKNELKIFEIYGILPEQLALIEGKLEDGIERANPQKINGKENEKMGLSPKVYKYLEENYKKF